MWWWLLAAIVGSLAALAVVSYFWNEIRELILSWLRDNGISTYYVKKALVYLDKKLVWFRRKIRAIIGIKTYESDKVIKVEEKIYEPDEIDDPDVINELNKRKKLLYELEI